MHSATTLTVDNQCTGTIYPAFAGATATATSGGAQPFGWAQPPRATAFVVPDTCEWRFRTVLALWHRGTVALSARLASRSCRGHYTMPYNSIVSCACLYALGTNARLWARTGCASDGSGCQVGACNTDSIEW